MRRTRFGAERLARTADRLESGILEILERQRQQLWRLSAQLDALSPLKVLERGYSVARHADGQVLKRRSDLLPGLSFILRVSDGEVPAQVERS